jgi:hypothetical protein
MLMPRWRLRRVWGESGEGEGAGEQGEEEVLGERRPKRAGLEGRCFCRGGGEEEVIEGMLQQAVECDTKHHQQGKN